MLRILFSTVLLAFGAAVASAAGVAAPNFSLQNPDGQTITLNNEVADQTTILFFWATWCPYCKALMPHLQSIELEYGDQVKVLAINIFEDGDPVATIRDAGFDFELLLEGDKVAETYNITGTPGVLIVGTDRRVHFDLRGVPPYRSAQDGKNHRSKAALRAPYWASAIRQALDRAVAVDASR